MARVKGDLVSRDGAMVVPIEEWLRRAGRADPEELGRLTADLSDLYDCSTQLVTQIHTLLRTRPDDPERVSDALWDLWETLHHMAPTPSRGATPSKPWPKRWTPSRRSRASHEWWSLAKESL